VACFDQQQALPTPPRDNAAFRYTSRLLTYNFAVFRRKDWEMLKVIYGTGVKEKELPLRQDQAYCNAVMKWQAASSNNDNL
jgi:hypothetical protein